MADEIIEELWAIKDGIAAEAGYDVDKLVELLHERHRQRERQACPSPDQQTTHSE